MAIKLDSLSPTELQALIRNAEAQMESARKHQVHEVRNKIDALLKDAGLSIDEVYTRRGGRGAKSPKVVVAPKYRNPANAAQTWSGRGKRPQWFSAALKKKGVTVESMLIERNATKALPIKAARKASGKASAKRAAKK